MKTKIPAVEKPVVEKLTVGLDLGDRRHTVCVLDASGEILAEEAIANTREVLTAFCARYPGATVVMETGTHSPWVSRLVAALGHPVIVANARKLRDAEATHSSPSRRARPSPTGRTRRCSRASAAPIRSCSARSATAARRRSVLLASRMRLKVREALVRSRVNLVNSVRFLLKSLGVFVSSSIKAMAFTRKVRAQLAPADVALVAPLLAAIDALNAEIKQLDAELEALAHERYPATERLRQIPGVGPLTALCFVPTLEDSKHFEHARAVGPYLGLGAAPRPIGPNRQTAGNHQGRARAVALPAGQLRALYPRQVGKGTGVQIPVPACWSTARTISSAPSARLRSCARPANASQRGAASPPKSGR